MLTAGIRVIYSAIFLFCVALPLRAQQSASSDGGVNLGQLYAQGMAEFQAGAYDKAAADLESLTLKADLTPQLEPVFFTVGSAYFNLNNYQKALAAFRNYQAKFPSGAHINDAVFGVAQCQLLLKQYKDAAATFALLERDPRLRDQVRFFEATALKELGNIDPAIAVLEKLAANNGQAPVNIRGATMLAQLYVKKGDSAKAIATIEHLRARARLVDNIVELSATTVQLGDDLYKSRKFADALACYRAAFSREEILRMQTTRIGAMQREIESNLAAARQNPAQFTQLAAENNQLKTDIARSQKLLEEFQKLPSVTPAIYFRMARCFDETNRKWEAIVAYSEIVDRFPKTPECEPALFGLILALADVNQAAKAQTRAEQYVRDFKSGPNAETVSYLMGAMALQANDAKAAENYFHSALTNQPKSSFREQMRYLLANAKFAQGAYDDANEEYKKYLKDFPKGQFVEDVNYRSALTQLFSGKYENAMNALRDYIGKHPQGSYITDAKYRLAVCKYAASLYPEVIADCQAWEREYPDNQQLGEVLAMLADAYAASGREAEAIPVYVRSYKIAATDEVMNYSLFAASKLLQKKGDWEKLGALFEDFVKAKPDNPTVISALYWVGKAKAHEGKLDEAKRITADTIKKYIDDPAREPVELLLSQLAQLCVKKAKPVDGVTAAPATDPGAEMDALLGSAASSVSATAKARILYAKAELARLRRQPAEEEKNIGRIAQEAKPEDLSPLLLGRVGDYLAAHDQDDRAATLFQRLMDEFPKSDFVDYAYNGLGQIALAKNDLPRALHFFSDGTDKIAATQKLKGITLGKAKTLLAMGKLDESRKLFEQVASVREWRGEATAFAVYSLGEIEAKQSHWAEANAYFQRVYVGYQKFLPWVAKSYLRSGECFEKLNKPQEAANTYRELLRKADERKELANFSETAEARKRLAALGQS